VIFPQKTAKNPAYARQSIIIAAHVFTMNWSQEHGDSRLSDAQSQFAIYIRSDHTQLAKQKGESWKNLHN